MSAQQEQIPGNDFGDTLRILVAEQEKAVRDALVERIYDTLGVHADAVNTVSGVKKLLSTHPGEFVLAVVATRLPDAPEGEVLEPLTAEGIPTIAISSQITDPVAARLEDRHVIDCVLKRSDEDVDLIAELIERTLLNHTRKILFYTNNDFNRKTIRQLLDIHRYTVIDVRNIADIRRQLDAQRDISLVLVDHNAIADNDLQLINNLRAHYRSEDLSIVAVCGEHKPSTTSRLLRAGANDVISKPYQTDEFYFRIKQCVETVERVREIKYSATRDPLTGIYNRDYFFDIGEKLYAGARRGDTEISLAIVQIDGFDSATTRYGIDTSNAVLKTLAPLLQNELRANDVLATYKAGTFSCLVTNVGEHNAIMVFERIRQLISKTTVEHGRHKVSLTGSIGVTTAPDDSFITMVANAQLALDEAIADGRNRVKINSD